MATIDVGKISFTQKGTWTSGTAYTAKDVVQHTDNNETSSYVAIASSTGQAPSTNGTVNSSNWVLFAKGATVASNYQTTAWASGTTYDKGDVVQYTDTGTLSTYLCIANSSQGNAPSSSGTVHADWSYLAKGTASVALSWQSVQTSNFTAQAASAYPVNTTGGSITVALPASPSVGDRVVLKDYARTWQTNSVVISPNGTDKYQGSNTIDPVYNTEGDTVDIVYVDSTKGWLPIHATDASQKTNPDIRFLVIAGGGSAGNDNGGGGGAGGFRGGLDDANGKFTPTASTTYTATVGAGGSGSQGASWNSGSNSSLAGSGLTTVTATGGGRGGSGSGGEHANNGGSGGGGGQQGSNAGTGNAGGFSPVEGYDGGSSNSNQSGGCGGGGAGGAGQNASGSSGQASVGDGGIAKVSNITGSDVYYAGGGGGGNNQGGGSETGLGGGTATTSQKGGAGNGANSSSLGGAATANTGGGAGGSAQNYNAASAPQGGSGVVIVKIPSSIYASSTGSPTITDVSGSKVLKFTGTGTFTTTAF